MAAPLFQKRTQSNMKTSAIKTVLGVATALVMNTVAFGQTGKVWVKVTDAQQLNTTSVTTLFRTMNVTGVEKAFPASRSKELNSVYTVSCNCDANDLMQAMTHEGKVFVRPELAPEFQTLGMPNDYSLAFANDYALNLIGAPEAWDITTGDTSVQIAITDANYHLGHEELIGKYNYVSENYSTDYTHGTAVAITAAGNTNNGSGKSAIGYNSRLQLRAMDYNELIAATYSGAKVINMSWASGCYYNYYAQEVINEVYNNGSTLIAAAGNGGTCGGPDNLVYPAAYDHVIAVSSVGPMDNHERYVGNPASTHQHNASVDICAPGYDVALTTAPGYYVTGNGTSFAAPYVSGTVALMYAVNPCLNPDQVEYILKATALNIDAQNPQYVGKLGAGRMQAAEALKMAAKFNTMTVTGTTQVECTTMEQSITLNLNYDGTAPFTIEWNNGATTETLVNVEEGTYAALIHDSKGCIATFQTQITAMVPMTVNATTTAVLCHGGQNGAVAAVAEGGNGEFTYTWDNGVTGTALNNLKEGFYTVTVTDGNGCTAVNGFYVTEPAALTATIAHSDAAYTEAGQVDVEVNGGTAPYTYAWNNEAATQDLTEVEAGFYEVMITDANGCITSANAVVAGHEAQEEGPATIAAGTTDEGNTVNQEYALGVNEQTQTTTLNVYPNPATDHATVTWNDTDVKTVTLVTLMGQEVQTIETENYTQKVELQGVAQGEYLVKLTTIQGQQLVKKVIFL